MHETQEPRPLVRPAVAGPLSPPPADSAGLYPSDYLAIVWRHRVLALLTLAAVMVPTLLWTAMQTPVYEATTRLLLEEPASPVPQLGRQPEGRPPEGSRGFLETEVELLQSRALARRTIVALDLDANPQFLSQPPTPLSPRAWMRLFGAGSPALASASPAGGADREPAPGLIDLFLQRLYVAPLVDSRLVDVKYELADAALAARIVNGLAREYIAFDRETRFRATADTAKWLEAQLADQREAVAESEQALQRYKEQQDALSVEDRQNIVVQGLTDLNSAVTRAKTERITRQQVWNQVEAAQSDRAALEATPAIMQSAVVQQLKGQLADLQRQRAQAAERYGERHPEMIRIQSALDSTQQRLDTEIERTVSSIRNEYLAARAQERSLSGALQQQKAAALNTNRQSLEYAALEREAQSDRQVYEALLQQAKQTGLAADFSGTNIRIVDPADTPRWPVRPHRARTIALGAIGALALALGLVFTREFLDRRIKTPDDLRQAGLGFLGIVPEVTTDAGEPVLYVREVPAAFGEAMRRIRSNVLLAVPEPGPRALLVTSAAPREGKTLIAANLAVALSALEQRVVLVDADLRRPGVHETFGLKRKPGLSEVLARQAAVGDALQAVPDVPRLSVLAAGPMPPNPAELLGGARFRTLLDELATQFDWIVIDTAPIMAVADTLAIAADVSAVVFVAAADVTRRDVADEALGQIRASGARLAGGVLNRAALERDQPYYARYYDRAYEAYYTK